MVKIKLVHPPFYRHPYFLWTVGIIFAIIILIMIIFRVSPWPGAYIIRYVFSQNDSKVTQALEKHAPKTHLAISYDQQYQLFNPESLLDVYVPRSVVSTTQKLPLIIWTHGGAWISGGKEDNATYYKLLAAEGFVVVSLDYGLGPEHTYPSAIRQINDAYTYIMTHADRYNIDTSKILLAGDSAGSQLSSQMATIITNPDYAASMDTLPTLRAEQLKGVILNCGIYMMDGLVHPDPTLPKIIGWGDDVSVWAYTGTKNFATSPIIKQMSAYYHVTSKFPATYIAGGNADPLTNAQSRPFADKLEKLGVPVTRLFYSTDHQPALPHEYQFNLDNQDGKDALKKTIEFAKSVTR